MAGEQLDPRLPLLQTADLKDKIVLLRVDHNVVKKGRIEDPYRIDATLATLFHIVAHGGRPILMTHVGRPKDKKGLIKISDDSSVKPIVEYLERRLSFRLSVPEFPVDPERGHLGIDTSINLLINDLKARRVLGIYLPNTRWFEGEEAKDERRARFTRQLAGLADVYVNDAFGSWQPHASTFDITTYLPSFAGFLMQKELGNLNRVLEPARPFLAVVAGAKYDTKIGPLMKIYEKVDRLILGGVIYNTFLCAKYGFKIAGVEESDINLARELVKIDEQAGKIVELTKLVESETLEGRKAGQFRVLDVKDLKSGQETKYLLDVALESFSTPTVAEAIAQARTIFVNAVMGLTPHFWEGSAGLYDLIHKNRQALKLYGGGDTLQEFKNLNPGQYMEALDSERYYFFTGGGTVLTAIEQGSPYGLPPVKALMDSAL